ncbi:MAG: T9SS type A sorting domain-containing protein [Chitinophagaceae bacterium]|nr:T9SS type A sorting domain-containing protein [Chitinophagaceae bacterium]
MIKIFNSFNRVSPFFPLLIFLVCISNTSFAQNPLEKQWDHSYGGADGDFLYHLIATPDSGFVAAGDSQSDATFEKSQNNWDNSSFPTYDTWIIKCDANGIKEWDRTLGGTDDEFVYSVTTTSGGGYMVAGRTRSPVSGDISQSPIGVFDVWAVKIDADGNIEWEHRYGGNGNNGVGAVLQLADGGFLFGAYTDAPASGDVSDPSYGSTDFWVFRTDASGNIVWDKRYGGNESENISDMCQTADGGFLLAGGSLSNTSGVKTQNLYVNNKSDLWFVKIDSSGNYLWDKQLGSLNDDYRMDLLKTSDHQYLLGVSTDAGIGGDKTQPTNGITDFWMIKTDTSLNVIWDLSIGGSGHEDDFGNISENANGEYMICGTSYSDPGFWKSEPNNGPENTWIVMVDSNGNKLWDKTILTGYTHEETGLGTQLKDGCYLFANNGDAFTQQEKTDPSHSFDYWCIKYCDTSFQEPSTPVSVSAFSASPTEVCEKYCTDFIDSSANNPTSWQWSFPGGVPATSTLQHPVSICYNDPGFFDVTLITCNQYGCDTLTLLQYIEVHPTPDPPVISQNGNILTATGGGTYQWQFNGLDIPGATGQSYTATQSGIYLVTVTDSNGCNNFASITVEVVGINSISKNLFLHIYPNPADEVLHLELASNRSVPVSISIKNTVGQVIFSSLEKIVTGSNLKIISIDEYPRGVYFLEIRMDDGFIVEKFSIE